MAKKKPKGNRRPRGGRIAGFSRVCSAVKDLGIAFRYICSGLATLLISIVIAMVQGVL